MADPPGGSGRKAGLSDAKRRLLEARLKGGARTTSTSEPRIAPRPVDEPVRATPYQESIWFLDQLVGDSAAYNIHTALRIKGPLDVEALAGAWNRVTARHESLRLLLVRDADRLFLNFAAVGPMALEHLVLPGTTSGGQEDVMSAAAAFARRPFSIDAGPLCRAGLLTLPGGDHLLVLAVHHVVCDEQSLAVVLADLFAEYRRRTEGDTSEPACPAVDFGDYASGMRRGLAESREADFAYWRDALAGIPDRLDLPTDHPRGDRVTFRGALVSRRCTRALHRELGPVADRGDLYPACLAAYFLMLSRYCGTDDVAVGSPVTLRDNEALANMVGLFVNPVVLRAPAQDGLTAAEFIAEVRRGVHQGLMHRSLPFEALVAELAPLRAATHNPFFQVMFVLETLPELTRVPGLDMELLRLDTGTAKMDLTVFVRRGPDRFEVTAEYNTDLFETATVTAMLAAYEAVLAQLTSSPELPLTEVSLVPWAGSPLTGSMGSRNAPASGDSSAELAGPRVDCDAEPLLPIAIGQAADRAGTRPALVEDTGARTYLQLMQGAAALGDTLAGQGVGPDVPVAILMDHGMDFVEAIVAVQRAGGAYVPLDPGWPDPRLADVLSELAHVRGEAVKVVSTAATAERVRRLGHRPVVPADPAGPKAAATSPVRDLRAEHLAYVIFTSGSTGKPKGVAVEHGNLRHANVGRVNYYGDSPGRFLLVSPLHFDSSVAGLFWTLSTGGTLVLPRPGDRADPRYLARLIAREQVTHTLMLPSVYALLLSHVDADQLATLRTVIVAGESCSPTLVDLHRHRLPAVELVNEYGPTEATVWASAWHAGADPDPVSLGWPIANTSLAVVDRCRNPLPPGAAGELCIGGGGIARGYLNDPGGTAERFVTLGHRPGERWYRSGDRVRQRADGAMEFLGRQDQQVKVRGYRIEPAAIEDALRGLPQVNDAAVTTDPEGARLVAWCVGSVDSGGDDNALRKRLARTLPAYLVPDRFEFLAELPRTGTGKVDRSALSVAAGTRAASNGLASHPASESPAETESQVVPGGSLPALREIWRSLLQTDRVAASDNFFDAGGHSLLGVQLLLEIEARLGRSLPLAVLFEAPTLGALAERIDQRASPSGLRCVSPVRAEGHLAPLFCVHGAIRRVAPHLNPDRPVYLVYRDLGTEDFADLTVEDLARAYLDELRTIQPEGPYHLCGFSFGGQIAYEMARQLVAAGESVGLLGLLDPPPVTNDAYVAILLQRKWAQLREVHGLAGKFGFAWREFRHGLSRVLARQKTYMSARRRESQGVAMATAELQERDRRNYIRASQSYHYPPYEGAAMLVMPERVESVRTAAAAGFADRIGGGLSVRIARGAHAHEDMMKEPHCRWLGEALEEGMRPSRENPD